MVDIKHGYSKIKTRHYKTILQLNIWKKSVNFNKTAFLFTSKSRQRRSKSKNMWRNVEIGLRGFQTTGAGVQPTLRSLDGVLWYLSHTWRHCPYSCWEDFSWKLWLHWELLDQHHWLMSYEPYHHLTF